MLYVREGDYTYHDVIFALATLTTHRRQQVSLLVSERGEESHESHGTGTLTQREQIPVTFSLVYAHSYRNQRLHEKKRSEEGKISPG